MVRAVRASEQVATRIAMAVAAGLVVLASSACSFPSYFDKTVKDDLVVDESAVDRRWDPRTNRAPTEEETLAAVAANPNVQAAGKNLVVYEVHPEYQRRPPECVAVLPFKVPPGAGVGDADAIRNFDAETVRRAFYAQLAPQSKRDIELITIDYALSQFTEEERADHRRIGQMLGCDSLMVGRVTTYGVEFFGLYSRVAVGASVKIIRASDGELLWEGHHVAQSHGGDVPISPIGILFSVVSAVTNLHEEQLERVTNDLARRLVSTIPDYQLVDRGLDPGALPARMARTTPAKDYRYVVVEVLNFRSGPGTNFQVQGKLRQSEVVEVVGRSVNPYWLTIKTSDGRIGYVSSRYLRVAGGRI